LRVRNDRYLHERAHKYVTITEEIA